MFLTASYICYLSVSFTYKNTFGSKQSCQNTSSAAKMSVAFGILLLAALELFFIPANSLLKRA